MGVDLTLDKQWLNAPGCHDHRGVAASIVDQGVRPGLEPHAVDKDDIRLCHSLGIGRIRLIEVRIGIRSDNGCDIGKITCHLRDHVAKDREACHNLQPVRRGGRS